MDIRLIYVLFLIAGAFVFPLLIYRRVHNSKDAVTFGIFVDVVLFIVFGFSCMYAFTHWASLEASEVFENREEITDQKIKITHGRDYPAIFIENTGDKIVVKTTKTHLKKYRWGVLYMLDEHKEIYYDVTPKD